MKVVHGWDAWNAGIRGLSTLQSPTLACGSEGAAPYKKQLLIICISCLIIKLGCSTHFLKLSERVCQCQFNSGFIVCRSRSGTNKEGLGVMDWQG